MLLISSWAGEAWCAQAGRLLRVDDFANVQRVFDLQPSPDGKWIAYLVETIDLARDESRSQLWRMSSDGREGLPMTPAMDSVAAPRWSPDGRYLSFLANRTQGESQLGRQLWALDRRGGEALPLTAVEGALTSYAWSPDGRRLALVIRAENAAAKAERDGKPMPYVIDRFQFKNDRDGYLHNELQPARIFLYDIATRSLAALTADARFEESSPVWSPDGSRIAFVSNRDEHWDRTINEDVWIVDARAGATPRRLTHWPGADTDPQWSPDGNEIVYLEGPEPKFSYYGPGRLAVVAVADGKTRYLATELDRDITQPRYSDNGRSIDFLVRDNRVQYLARTPVRGGAVKALTSGSEVVSTHASVAGKLFVLTSRDAMPAEIHAVERGVSHSLTTHNAAWLANVDLAETTDIEFTAADGTRVYGLLSLPPGSPVIGSGAASPLPMLLWIHGGPYWQDEHSFDFRRQLFAAQGYAVLQVNYRGSIGRGTAFGHGIFADWGNKDLTDLLDGVKHVIGLGVADPQRLMVGGWSNGGIMTNYVIARDPRFKAAVSGAGYGNLLSYYGSDMYSFVYDHELGPPWQDRERWLRLSFPLFEVDRIRTPTLFIGGQLDFNVPVIGSEQMYQALKSLNVPAQLVIYPGEHHGISRPSFQRDRLERYVAWYAKYLAIDLALAPAHPPTPAAPDAGGE